MTAQFGVVPAPVAGAPAQPAQLKTYADMPLNEPLPAGEPQLVYVGVEVSNGKDAAFALTGAAILHGSATCKPSPTQCQAILLAPGQSETLEVLGATGQTTVYELKLISVTKTVSESASTARAHGARAHTAGGPRATRRQDGRWSSAPGYPGCIGATRSPRRARSAAANKLLCVSLRLITAGESHGPGLTCIVEGLPAGLSLTEEGLNADMARRQLGHGRGGRMKIERDRAEVTAGVRHGFTLGGPVALQVKNRDYANWEERMNPWPVAEPVAEVHLPRPGHADLVGAQKYNHTDIRNILERASARETAARVAGGALCRAFLAALGVHVRSHVVQIASVHAPAPDAPLVLEDFAAVDASPVRCLDAEASGAMVAEIDRLRKANESLGGVFEVQAFGLVPGLGSHISWEQRLDGRLAMAICSIQALKGVSIGDGFEIAGLPGSQAHDEIFYDDARGYYRETNRAGGLEGGMTNGQPLIVRGAMKPLPTLTKPLRSVNTATHAPAEALRERTDSCTVPAAGVVGEAMVALVLADAYRQKFGGDHIDDVTQAVRAYTERIGWHSS